MKRLAIATGVVVLGTGAAFADCTHADSPNGNEDSFLFDNFRVTSGSDETCTVTSTSAAVPAGHFGVFRQRMQGFAALESGDTAVFRLDSNGDLVAYEVNGEYFDNVDFLRYTATGLVDVDTAYTADLTVDLNGASSLDAEAQLDTLDVLVGYTTLADQEDSLDLVGLQQLALITHLDGNATLLRSGDQLVGEDELGLLGSYGSYNFGATARYNLADGFSLLGGVSLFGLGAEGANANGVLATGAIRYVDPTGATVRFFGEGGFEAAGMGLTLSRDYDAGSGDIEAGGSGTGALGAAYIRGGVLWEPDANNQVVLSASVKQSVLGLFSFVEDDSDTDPNLFAADYSGQSTSVTTIKTGVDWTTQLSHDLDLTASGAVGAAFGSGASANIFGVSEFTGEAVTGAAQSVVFAQYGLRLGWTPTTDTRVEGFVQGTTGTGIGTHAQIGAAYKLQF